MLFIYPPDNYDSKFGQRILEKFGWSKGSGLGKNQQGISDIIKVHQKVTPTGLGFIANNADDWFKAGDDYSRLLSQLTEKFDQYQALSEANEGNAASKKSLEQNSLNSKSRVHYHKFTKGKDLTQYKQEELMCILGKGVKDDDENSKNLNIKEYFKLKQESKKIQIAKNGLSSNEDSMCVNIDDEANERITVKEDMNMCINVNKNKINVTSPQKKQDSQFSTEIEIALPNECDDVKLKKKKKKMKAMANDELDNKQGTKEKVTNIPFVVEDIDQLKKKKKLKKLVEIVDNSKQSIKNKSELLVDICVNNEEQKKKKSKLKVSENIDMEFDNDCNSDNIEKTVSDCNNYEEIVTKQDSELVLTHKYQSLVDLLIENSSAGKKYSNEASSPLFEKKMKEFADSVKRQLATKVSSSEIKSVNVESVLENSKTLNPNDKNFINDFEIHKSKALESASKRQDVTKYVNDKSMFIANHGDVLFFGSNINDIKGYGDW